MDNTKLLEQIGELIEKKLDQKLDLKFKPIKQQLDTVEMKVEAVNKKVESTEQNLLKEIDKSQEETIASLSDLINESYNLQDKRIKKIENHLHISQTQ